MDSRHYDPPVSAAPAVEVPLPVKIAIAGGFAVGKTTTVAAISEIAPLTTEAAMTDVSVGVDDTTGAEHKASTTVAMDFGRVSLGDDLILYLFGTPGQDRFRFMWDDLIRGAIGAVVLVDTTRLADCFPAVDYFEAQDVPFVVAVNCFHGEVPHPIEEVREALQVRSDVPLILMDARDRESVRATLMELVQHALVRTAQ
jgi:signal recognition particle receptor subunit beta